MDVCTLFKIINCQVDCPELLQEIPIHAPQRTLRDHNLFYAPFHHTNYGLSSAITRFCNSANTVGRDTNIDFFCDSFATFKEKLKSSLY